MQSLRSQMFAILLSLGWSFSAQGDVIVYYDLNGVPSTAVASVSATTVVTGATAIELTRGAGAAATNLLNGFSANGWDGKTSLAEALNLDAYFQFGLSIDNGYSAALSTLDLSLRRSALAAPSNMALQFSLDGFATSGTTLSSFNYLGRTSSTAPSPNPIDTDPYYYMTNDLPGRPNSSTSPGDAIPTVDLSGVAELQGLQAGDQVAFRLYAWGSSSTASTNTLALGRMVGPSIGGTVTAVPEPSSFGLVLLGAVAVIPLRHRRN